MQYFNYTLHGIVNKQYFLFHPPNRAPNYVLKRKYEKNIIVLLLLLIYRYSNISKNKSIITTHIHTKSRHVAAERYYPETFSIRIYFIRCHRLTTRKLYTCWPNLNRMGYWLQTLGFQRLYSSLIWVFHGSTHIIRDKNIQFTNLFS